MTKKPNDPRPTGQVIGILVAAGILTIGAASPAQAETFVYSCVLSAEQVAPPTGSSAIGGGYFIIDTDLNTVSYRIAFTGLSGSETAAHIHGFASPGDAGGILHSLPLGNPKVGVWSYDEAQEPDILAGLAYVNIHSSAFPGGEIRGQITSLNASLDGEQESPPTGSTATGWGVFTVDTAANTLDYYIVFDGLSSTETAAHIHGFALQGSSGGVLHSLPLGSPKVGTWNYSEDQELGILTGLTYVNIHSANFPGGEIRGQIVPLVVPVDGEQEVPPTGSPAAGIGLLAFDLEADALGYDIRVAGLSGVETAAHIHGFAAPGENGGVLHSLPPGPRKVGVWTYGAGGEPGVLAGLTYINVHTEPVSGGEIRGQIVSFLDATTASSPEVEGPASLRLLANAPNPMRSSTRIRLAVARSTPARLVIYDVQGRVVRTLFRGVLSPGSHAIEWDGRDDRGRPVARGAYRYALHTPGRVVARGLSVLR
jgi:hypothetical protein